MVWRVWRFILEIWEARLFDKMAYYAEKAYKQIAMEAANIHIKDIHIFLLQTRKNELLQVLNSSRRHSTPPHSTFMMMDEADIDLMEIYQPHGKCRQEEREKRRGRVRNVKNHALPPANRRRLSDSSSSSEKSGEEKNIHEIPKIHKFSAPDMWENICTVTMIWEERWRKGKEKEEEDPSQWYRNTTETTL